MQPRTAASSLAAICVLNVKSENLVAEADANTSKVFNPQHINSMQTCNSVTFYFMKKQIF